MKNFNPNKIKVIGFDADDTLWMNEPYFRDTEAQLTRILRDFGTPEHINKQLYEIETANMELYGYGIKAFVLSLIETAVVVSGGKVGALQIAQIVDLGKRQIALKNEMLPGVEPVLQALHGRYKLIVATKGDLLDQERKLKNSGILDFFHHVEVMTDKKDDNYRKLIAHLDISPSEFLMVGNSLKSDVIPVVRLGGYAIHVPFRITWLHEEVEPHEIPACRFAQVSTLKEILPILGFSGE